MKLYRLIFLCCILWLPLQAGSKHILLLHSYNKGLFWSDEVSKGVEAVLEPYKEYQLTTEYMDTKKNEDPEYLNHLYTLFKAKLKNQNFDAVIATDDFAVKFVLDNKEEFFANLPIVFCGIEKSNPGVDVNLIKHHNIPLVLESKEILINMRALKKIMPNLEHVYIISDQTRDSMAINPFFKEGAKELENMGIHVTLNFEANVAKITDDIAHLPPNSAVILGTLVRDNQGMFIPYYQVIDLINASSAPVFAVGDTLLSRGIVGGYLLRGYTNGVAAAQLIVNYLQGYSVDMKEPLIVPSEWIFDYAMLEKYNIDSSKLPKEATIINLPQSFFEKYRSLIDTAFILFPFVLISLFLAILNIYQRHKTAKELAAKNYWEQVLLNNIHSSLFWVDTQGIVKGCNDAFCTLVGLSLEKIIGRALCDVFAPLSHLSTSKQGFIVEESDFTWGERMYRLRSRQFLDENSQNSGVVSVIMDITEKKQLEIHTQLNIQQSKLAEIGEMLSAIVHQWKVPLVELSAVAHKLHYYDQKKKLTSEDVQKFYDIIMQQTIYMGETIDGFRDFIRPSTVATRFDLEMAIQEVRSLLSFSMKYNHMTLLYTPSTSTHKAIVWGFPNEFKQVLVNIINNAKDAILEAREKRLPTKGTIYITLDMMDKDIVVGVEDDGIGVNASIHPKLFDPFFTTKPKGDGFGLYMARLIIESKMHGKISLEALPMGVKVSLILPPSQENMV